MVALPLCVAIAKACGLPPEAGLITGIVGGLVVGVFAGSPLQVSGPAAGLIVLVLDYVNPPDGVARLGWIVLLGGLLQLVAGVLRLGQWFRAVSPAVVLGMLAGIGLIILAKQFHVLFDTAGPDKILEALPGDSGHGAIRPRPARDGRAEGRRTPRRPHDRGHGRVEVDCPEIDRARARRRRSGGRRDAVTEVDRVVRREGPGFAARRWHFAAIDPADWRRFLLIGASGAPPSRSRSSPTAESLLCASAVDAQAHRPAHAASTANWPRRGSATRSAAYSACCR